LREAQSLREESRARYDSQSAALLKTKEKLYRKQDLNEWRVSDQDRPEAAKVMGDPNKALKFILPEVLHLF
jgi:hypothetical protein